MIILLVASPETKYHRSPIPVAVESATPVTELEAEKIAEPSARQHLESHQISNRDISVRSLICQGRPSKSQFNLIQRPDKHWKRFLVRDLVTPIHVFLFPIILWAGLNVAGPANVLLLWNLTESTVFSGPPYDFSPGSVGYTNFAFVVGGIIGVLTAGPISDWVATKLTIRNKGVREAEMRLPAMIPFCLLTLIGTIIGSIGYQRHWSWPIILVLGYGLTGLSVTTVPTIAIAYAVGDTFLVFLTC